MKATINNTAPTSQEDIFKVGNLVISKEGSIVIIVSRDNSTIEGRFIGTTLNESRQHNPGEYQIDWVKHMFELFIGTITLEN